MHRLVCLYACLAILSSFSVAGELSNATFGGCDFHDAGTGLYWLDPWIFRNIPRADVDAFVDLTPSWEWATSAQIDGLLNSTIAYGENLEYILGPATQSIYGALPQWWGLYASTSPEAWYVASYDHPYDTIDDTGAVASIGDEDHGAWLVSTVDPASLPRLDHLGSIDCPYFHDQATGLYWCDQDQFIGMDRAAVEDWLAANPDWRWATSAEARGLIGKRTVGDHYLGDVVGMPQVDNDHVMQFICYCGDLAGTQALVLQSGIINHFYRPSFLMFSSVMGDATGSNAGAWIVSDINPTPLETKSLSEVKQLFE